MTVKVAAPPGEMVLPPLICRAGTLAFLIVVSAHAGLPTEYPEPVSTTDIMTVGFGSTSVLTRVCTVTVVEVVPEVIVAVAGGVTISSLPAVPLDARLTVRSLLGAGDALMTKEAAAPCETTSSTDWIVRTGLMGGFTWDCTAVNTAAPTAFDRGPLD